MATNLFDMSLTVEQLATPITQWFDSVDAVRLTFDARNEVLQGFVNEKISMFSQPINGYRKVVDVTPYAGNMAKLGEDGHAYGDGDKQVVKLDFPLWKFGDTTGWTEEFLMRGTVNDLRQGTLKTEQKYLNSLDAEITAAIFNPVQRTSVDFLTDHSELTHYPFINANNDSMAIRPAPNGTTFNSASHTHYVGTSGSAVSTYDIDTLISNVVEHGNMNGIMLFVDSNMPATLAAMAGTKFSEPEWFGLRRNDTTNTTVEVVNPNRDPLNAMVGRWGPTGVPIMTRSWVPSGYIACMATEAAEKPLGFRQDRIQTLRGLVPLSVIGQNVIVAKEWRAYFGFAANNRAAGACLDTTHQTNYSAPSGLVL